MRKGNTYELRVMLSDSDGASLDLQYVDQVEFIFGTIRKVYPDDVKAEPDSGDFLVLLSQEDTFELDRVVDYQARVKFVDGSVAATEIYRDVVRECLSKVVL